MKVRLFPVAIAAAATAAATGAQPDKGDSGAKARPPVTPAPVVLASASDSRRPSPTVSEQPAQTVRRPAPRVTTCRCGDPQLSPDQSAEEQPDR